MATNKKIQKATNYRLFSRSADNRPLDAKKHKNLMNSMKEYGFLDCFPIIVSRTDKGGLVVKDGQHRLAIAETLSLPVYWVEDDTDFDIAKINCTSRTWTLHDFARRFSEAGNQQYLEAIAFAESHRLPLSTSVALLAGTSSFGNVKDAFESGEFRVKDRSWATAAAGIYVAISAMDRRVANRRFIEACMAVCRVPGFDSKRLIAGAERCRDKLGSYSTRDAYLDVMEEIYNFGRKQLVGLKSMALMAMKERSPSAKKKTSNTEQSA